MIKQATTTGGGTGVVNDAVYIDDVQTVRRELREERCLLQRLAQPFEAGGMRFWFRVFFVLGSVNITWWDDRTHRYSILFG